MVNNVIHLTKRHCEYYKLDIDKLDKTDKEFLIEMLLQLFVDYDLYMEGKFNEFIEDEYKDSMQDCKNKLYEIMDKIRAPMNQVSKPNNGQ